MDEAGRLGATAPVTVLVWDLKARGLSKICQIHVTCGAPTPAGTACSANQLPQFTPQNLSRSRLGDDFHEMHFPRLFVTGQTIGDKPAQFLFHLLAGRKSVAEGDERHRYLTRLRIRLAHDSALAHRRMLQQHRLHLRRSDRESFVLDHFLASVHDSVKAFGVTCDNVTRPIPSVAQYGRSRIRLFPVTEHQLP